MVRVLDYAFVKSVALFCDGAGRGGYGIGAEMGGLSSIEPVRRN